MKKILVLFTTLLVALSLSAQTTVVGSKLFENTYFSVSAGTLTTSHPAEGTEFFWDGASTYLAGTRPLIGFEFGKYVTPVVGFGLETMLMFGTTDAFTFVDQQNTVGSVKLNLSNWFGGYLGFPRRIEVVLAPGIGWGHCYVFDWVDKIHPGQFDRNHLTYNLAAEFNVNFGKDREWQLNVKPVIMSNEYNNELKIRPEFVQMRMQVGFTYKFGSRRLKSHNFVKCPYSVSQLEYDSLRDKYQQIAKDYEAIVATSAGHVSKASYDSLSARYSELDSRYKELLDKKQDVKTVTETKEVVVTDTKFVPVGKQIVTFEIGSSIISTVEKAKLEAFVKSIPADSKIRVTGSADTKTGNEAGNMSLAESRAGAVVGMLSGLGITRDRIEVVTELDVIDVAEASRAAIVEFE